MSRNAVGALHSAIAAGLLALQRNGLSDRTDRRVDWRGQVEEIITAQVHWGAARLWAPCPHAGSDYGDESERACGDLARQAFAKGRITRPQVQFQKGFGDVLAVEDRLQ